MSTLEERMNELKAQAKQNKFTKFEDFAPTESEGILTSVCWAVIEGAPTPRVLLTAIEDETWIDDTAGDKLLQLAWQAPTKGGASEPVAALASDGKRVQAYDLDPGSPHEIDRLPEAKLLVDLIRLQREPTFKWSIKVYGQLQRGFNNFHERVYSSVRDTVDGKNHIIDEASKFLFLEQFRLRHSDKEKEFQYEGKKLTLDEVFRPEPFFAGTKAQQEEAVAKVRAAFVAFRGHPDYKTTDDEGNSHDIFSERVHLDLSVPSNYGTLIKLLQDLPPLTDNQDKPILVGGKQKEGTLADVAGDVLGRAFDVFLRHKFEKEGIGIYLTPAPVKRAMVEMALHDIERFDHENLTARDADGRPSFRVCDPTGGSAGFLVALLPALRRLLDQMNLVDEERERLWNDMLEHSFVAADSSARMVRLARLNMALHGAPRAKIFNTSTSLLTDLLKPNSFDLILTNPPFGAPKAKTAEEKKSVAELMAHFRTDIDFDALKGKGGLLRPSPTGLAMGANPNNKDVWKEKESGVDLSVLFLDRCLQLLKPGGRMLMIVPDSILCNANTKHVREYLIGKKDPKTGEFHGGKAIVRSVSSLPADTFKLSGTGAKTSILYVQKRKADKSNPERFADEPQTDVFMAVADTLGYSVKNNAEVFDVPNELVPIIGAFRRGE